MRKLNVILQALRDGLELDNWAAHRATIEAEPDFALVVQSKSWVEFLSYAPT